jgi:predicted acylesterase/phospholipase RssA/CRP-like cAMP-binding protein
LKRAVRAIRRLKELRAAALKRSQELRGMILEEGKIRAFQSVSLKMFDMPHQPRRMRQAVRIWRTWQAQTNLKARLKDIRGDGLSVLHKTEEDLRAAISAHGLATISPHESARPLDPTMDALRACAACRGMSETAIATLRSRVKTVTVRARERVGESVAPGELTVLVEGEVELKGQIEMDVSIRGDGESKALTTHCSRPGTCLNSFMDILEHVPQKWSAPGESPAAPAKSSDAPSSGQKSPRSEIADRVRVRLSFGAEKEEHQRDRVRVSARAAPGGCVLAVVKMSDFHECAGAVVGIQGTTLRLAGGFTALCKYLGMTSDLKSLWVDERVLSESTAFSANDAEPLLCTKALSCMFDDEVVDAIDTSDVVAKLERHGYRKSASKGAGTNGGGFFRKQKSVKDDITPQMSYEVALEATAYPAGSVVLRQGASPCAYLVEHGSLEAFMGRVPKRERPPLPNSPRFRRSEAPIFTANAGDVVGSHLLLTGQRSNLAFRAGSNGAVVVALPASALARLARSRDKITCKMASALARRVRLTPSSLVLDRVGSEIEMLEAGEALNQREGGVHIVVAGCLREQTEEYGLSRANSSQNLFKRRTPGKPNVSYPSSAPGYVVNPGEATGEDSVLQSNAADSSASTPRARRQSISPPNGRTVARAVRDSQVLWISSAGLDTLALAAPTAFVRLARGLGLRQANRAAALSASIAPTVSGLQQSHKASNTPKIVSVIPVTEGAAVHLDDFCYSLTMALRKICRVHTVDSACRLAELGQAAVGPLAQEATMNWLSNLELEYDLVILKGDPFPSPWCAQCARHSDTILLVANANDQAPTPTEGQTLQDRLLHGQGATKLQRMLLAQRELVLLHQNADITPKDTKSWLTAFSVQRHHHAAMESPSGGLVFSHAARLARSLRDLTVGLVMGGGGARGIAHVGVLAAMEEEGIPIDAVGGTSIGAMVGGMYARDPSALLVRIMVMKFAKEMSSAWGRVMDFTLPVVSYFTGWGMNRSLGVNFGETKIEDCWLPFFCCTLDLISCMQIIHRNGTLWRYVRASMALVGFLPPVCDTEQDRQQNMHVLVDGGYVNNLPTDVMRALGARFVIAVDVAGEGLDTRKLSPWGDGISGSLLLIRSLVPRWLGGGYRIPTMADMQGQLPFVTDTVKHQTRVDDIDVYIHPDVSSIGILEFNKYNAIIKHGYDIGLRLAREWKAENPDAAALLEHGSNRRGLASGSRDRKFNLPSDTNLSELSQRRARHDTSPTGAPREARTSESGIFHEETRSSDAYQFSDDDVALRRTSSDTRTMLTTDAMWTPTANKQKRHINF